MLHVPLPLESLGPRAAFGAETHRIAGGAGLERDLQPDVAEVGGGPRPDCDHELDGAVELHLGVHVQVEGAGVAARLPGGGALGSLREGHAIRGRRRHAPIRVRDDEHDGPREQLAWGVGEAGHLDGEATADGGGEPVGAEDHLAPEDVYRVAVRLDGRVGRHDAVVFAEP